MSKHRSRRLRKKLHVDEFQQLGFEVSFRLRDDLQEGELASFWERFILEAIEANGLVFGGGDTSGFITGSCGTTVNIGHRQLIDSWLKAQPIASGVSTGELVDAWYAPESGSAD